MKMIVLAAGTGSRLFPLTKNVPKSLLDLGDGRCLLERQIENAAACREVDGVVVVTGYRSDLIQRRLAQMRPPLAVEVAFNPVYALTNNLLSAWFGLGRVGDEDFLISNGDNLYRDRAFSLVSGQGEGIWLTINRKDNCDADDMKVWLEDDGTVRFVSKTEIPSDRVSAESVGLAVVRGSRYRRLFRAKVDEMLRDEKHLSSFWLEIFNALRSDEQIIRSVEIEATDWAEIDFHPDVNRIRAEIEAKVRWTD